MNYTEQSCTFEHEGKSYTSGGAAVNDKFATCYLAKDGIATMWHGDPIGTYRITSTWRTPRSHISTTMHQAEVTIDGVVYTGRTAGVGMVFHGKRKAKQPIPEHLNPDNIAW